MKNKKPTKQMIIGLKAFVIVLLLFFTMNLMASKTMLNSTLSPQDQANSDQFKSLTGQDRLVVFNLLNPLIISESSLVYAAPGSPSNLSTYSDVVSLLGSPDFTRSTNLFGYYLKGGNNSCLVIFGLNDNGQIQYTSINDCR